MVVVEGGYRNPRRTLRASGLSGQMHGSVFLDENGRVIRPALLWNDQRTAAECVEIEEKAGGREGLIRLVANPALTGFTAPKLLWLRRHEPQNWDRVRQVLLPERLHSLSPLRHLRDRGERRLGNAPPGRRQPSLEPATARQARPRSRHAPPLLRERRGFLAGQCPGRIGDRPGAGHSHRRRSGRSARGSGRQWDRPIGRCLGDDGNLGRRLRPCRRSRIRSIGTAPAILPRGPRCLVRLWRRARGGRKLAVVSQRAGQGGSRQGTGDGGRPVLCAFG